MNGPILIASDGGPGSEGAVRTGLALARERGLPVEVLTVLQPIPRYGVNGLAPFPDGYALYETLQSGALKDAVSRQLQTIGEEAAAWPVTVEVGSPAATIVRHAQRLGAGIVLVGAGEHAPLDRWLGEETALKVSRMATVPVLAVPRDATGLPTRALAAIDFSEHSLRAARAVLEVLGPRPRLFLVHLMWPAVEVEPFPSLSEWRRTYREGAEARLEEIAAGLRAGRTLDTECLVSAGDPAEELLALATRLDVGVVATGSHGYGFIGRMVMGSVSTQLLRRATCPVLVAPPEGSHPGLSAGPEPSPVVMAPRP